MPTNRLKYDPETGEFVWLTKRRFGLRAGTINSEGYRDITLDGKLNREHRLAWLFHYGSLPEGAIDHINGDRKDNRITNLRLATAAQNRMNSKIAKTNSSGFKGVTYHKKLKKWQASISRDYKLIHLGVFESPEIAHQAYRAAARTLYGEFARFE